MARNFEGLGVGIEVDDGGSTNKLQKLGRTVDDLWDGLKKAGTLAPKLGNMFSKGLGTIGAKGGRAFGAVTMAMGTMIDKAMSPELDHAYSSMYAGFNKSFSALTAGMDVTKKEMKDARKAIGGAAFGMGEDMDEAAKNWAAFRKQGIDLEEMLGTRGLTGTMKGLIKVTSVYEIQGEQLAVVVGSLTKGFNFTEEAVGSLADKIVASGKVFNMGKEAIQSWPAILESLNNELADFGKTLSPKEIENLTLSIVQLGGGLKEALGLAPQQAMEVARTMFTTIAGERKNIINMFRGMGGEFGDVAKGLMESGGDVNKMFEMMSTGDPLKFMDTLAAMSKEAQKRGGETGIAFQRLSGVMTQALGPDVAFAMKGNWDKARESMAKIPDALKGSEGMFKNIADEHWKSSITAGEAWDRMIQGMKARMFALSRKDVGAWKKQMKSGFEDTFQVISKMAADDGPLGELTRKFLAVQRVGLTALIPGLSGLAPLLGGVASSAMPVLTAMGSMGIRFTDLGKMVGVGGALWGVFQLLTLGPEKAWEKLQEFVGGFGEMFDKLPKKTQKKLLEVRDQFFAFIDDIKSGKLFDDISIMFGKVEWEKGFQTVVSVLTSVFEKIGDYLGEINWGKVIETVISIIGKAFKTVGGIIGALIFGTDQKATEEELQAGIGTMLFNAFQGARTMLLSVFKGFWTALFSGGDASVSGAMEGIIKIVVGGFATLMLISKKFRTKMISNTQTMFKGINLTSKAGWVALGRTAKTGMAKVALGIRAGLKAFAPLMAIMAIFEAIDQAGKRAVEIAEIMSDKSIKETDKMALAGESAFRGVLSTIDAVLMGLPSSLGKALGISQDDLTKFYHDMFAGMSITINAIEAVFSTGINNIVTLFFALKESVGGVWKWILFGAEEIFAKILGFVEDMRLGMTSDLYTMAENIHVTFKELASSIFYPFAWLGHKLKGWVASFIESIFGTEAAPTWAGTVLKQFDKEAFAGVMGQVKELRKEVVKELAGEKTFEEAYDKRAKQEILGVKSIYEDLQLEIDRQRDAAQAAMLAAAEGAAEGRRGAQIMKPLNDAVQAMVDGIDPMVQGISDYSKDAMNEAEAAAKTSMERRKRAAEEGKEEAEEEAGEEAGEGGKGKGKGKGKGVAPGAVTAPTAEERVPRGEQMIVKDMLALVNGHQVEMIKRSDALIAATKNIGTSPIDVYLDSTKIQKGLDKKAKRNAAGRGHK